MFPSELVKGLVGLAVLFAVWWVLGVSWARALKPFEFDPYGERFEDVWLALSPEITNAKLVPYGAWGGTETLIKLEIYIPLHDFQAIAYPDRERFVGTVGAVGCNSLDSEFYLPTVEFRDIRTGKRLAKHSCFLQSASLDSLD